MIPWLIVWLACPVFENFSTRRTHAPVYFSFLQISLLWQMFLLLFRFILLHMLIFTTRWKRERTLFPHFSRAFFHSCCIGFAYIIISPPPSALKTATRLRQYDTTASFFLLHCKIFILTSGLVLSRCYDRIRLLRFFRYVFLVHLLAISWFTRLSDSALVFFPHNPRNKKRSNGS